jgi:hypothetical protein
VGANLDLYIKAGEAASPSYADCGAGGAGPHGFCKVSSPATGTWYVNVVAPARSGAGGGDFQMTATTVGGAPVGVDDSYGVATGGALEVNAEGGVLANDEGTNRGALSATIDRQPEHGTVELASDGSFRYLPEEGYTGQDSFSYQVSDGSYQGPAEVVLMVGAAADGNGVLGGCAAGDGSGRAGGLAVLLLLVALLQVSQRVCGSRRS